jgi:uncharacterized membrane protein
MLFHPLAVHFPLALFLASTFFDLLAWRLVDPFYSRAASWLLGLGLLGALLSIALGWLDLLAMERLGIGPGLLIRHRVHSSVAYAATAAYGVNLGWRRQAPDRLAGARLALSLIGAVLIAVAGYLGGELRNVM